MINRYKGLIVVLAIILLSGFAPHVVNASASMGGDNQVNDKPIYEKTNHRVQHTNIDEFLQNCFKKWGIKWDDRRHHQNQEQETPKQDNNVEQPEVNEPTPAPEQQPEVQEPNEQQDNQQQISDLNQFEQQVVELTNQERAKYGLSALKADKELSRVAKEKSRDMQVNNYFAHNSPTYGSPFDMMKSYAIDYRSAGENIAKGQRTPQEVVTAWMNSEGHRANILNSSFTHIGVGYIEQGNIWTQQFIGK